MYMYMYMYMYGCLTICILQGDAPVLFHWCVNPPIVLASVWKDRATEEPLQVDLPLPRSLHRSGHSGRLWKKRLTRKVREDLF